MRRLSFLLLALCSCSVLFEQLYSNCESQAPRCDKEVSVLCVNGSELRVQCDLLCEPDDGQCAECGDGRLSAQLGEECDDSNKIDTDACTNQCLPAICGDGFIQEGVEECEDDGRCVDDDGLDPINGPPCQSDADCESNDCRVVSGDGCDEQCQLEVCGNGLLQQGPFPGSGLTYSEECEDGNTANIDGCTSTCLLERCGDGLINIGTNLPCTDLNGNGFCEPAEFPLDQCDDGNTNNDDGCDGSCQNE